MESHSRKQLILLALLAGINAVNVTESGGIETVHGWQAALADRLGIAPNVLTHWLRRGNVPAKRAAAAETTLGFPRPRWYRYDLTDQHIYNAALTGDPDVTPRPGPKREKPRAEIQEHPYNKSSPGAEPETHIRVADALTRTARILESGTSYGRALYHNILSFDRALGAEQKLDALAEDNKRLTQRIEEMESKQDEANLELDWRLAALEDSSAGRGKRQGRA